MNDVLVQSAWRAHRTGNRDEAARLCREILRGNPKDFNALYLLGFVQSELGRFEEAERLIGEAIKINPRSPDALYNRALILQNLSRYGDALSCYEQSLAIQPQFLDALINRGIVLHALKRHVEALASFDAALSLKPDDAECWNNRSSVLLELNRTADALAGLDKALTLNANYISALSNRGVALQRLKRHADALDSFGKALAIEPRNFTVLSNRGTTLLELRRYREALQDFDRALAIKPGYSEALINRGLALMALKDSERALMSYDLALKARPGSTDALFNRANAFLTLKRFEEAAKDCESLLKLDPEYKYTRGFLAFFRLQCCDWRDLDRQRREIAAGLRAGKRVIAPFANVALARSEKDQLSCASICIADRYPASSRPLWQGERYRHDKIRLAYLSGDFNSTAVATLIAGVFEHHDKAQFETLAVSFARDDKSPMRARLAPAFDRFIEVQDRSDAEVAQLLRQMEVDIAVDLMGFTGECRPGILAFRPAPVQVNYLGFPGTMGADYVDAIIADRTVIPEESVGHYSEAVVYLPDIYLPNDATRRIAERRPSRSDAGLPEKGFVFCSFNNSYKFTPELFDIWMRLLSGVEDSVLWLPEVNAAAVRNLRREAASRGIDERRLVFAPFLASAEDHLARLRLADLFLDTLPYNAHTTAADALWAGLPVLTTPGSTFAGRVAASLLKAIGLPEMIAPSLEAYEATALQLARDRSALAEIKAKLQRNRGTHALFDTARFTRNLEAAYVKLHEHARLDPVIRS